MADESSPPSTLTSKSHPRAPRTATSPSPQAWARAARTPAILSSHLRTSPAAAPTASGWSGTTLLPSSRAQKAGQTSRRGPILPPPSLISTGSMTAGWSVDHWATP